jgi:GNAT superfamily N-acetyltransferase
VTALRDPVPHVLRPMRSSDEGFVFKGWHRSYLDSDLARAPSTDAYYDAQRAVIATCLARGTVDVACWPEDEDHLLGFVAHAGAVVHYVYVKETFRRRGLGRALVEHAARDAPEVFVTHLRRVPRSWGSTRGEGKRFVFSPGLIFMEQR